MLYSLTTRVACISRLVLAVVALVALGAAPAGADQCTRAKLKAIGKKESGLLACQAKVAASGDSSGLSACESKVMAKFSHAFGNAGTCMGDQTACESIADGCESSVAGAFIDTFPSDCEVRKRKAAGKLAKGELGCYAKAATKGLPVDSVVCIPKSTMKFSVALTKAGTCPDGGSPQGFVESHCVTPAVTTDGGGVVTDVCATTPTTTTTLPFQCSNPGTSCGTNCICLGFANPGFCGDVGGYGNSCSNDGDCNPDARCLCLRACTCWLGCGATLCGTSPDGTCGGACADPGLLCTQAPGGNTCACAPPDNTCSIAQAPTCGGTCPTGEVCGQLTGQNVCGCVATNDTCRYFPDADVRRDVPDRGSLRSADRAERLRMRRH